MKSASISSRGRDLMACALIALFAGPAVVAQPAPAAPVAAPKLESRGTILFIGNSFTFADKSPVRFYRAQTVTDLNNQGIGGVPALFKAFANQAGLDFAVSLETAPGRGLDYHVTAKADVIGRPWDYVVMHGFSTLDSAKPGDPALLVNSTRQIAELLHGKNPKIDIRLMATWSRADQTYPASAPWHGKPIEAMARDVRAGYDLAAAGSPHIRSVIAVGEAWNRAMQTGIADPNPYDGIAAGQINLWAYDHYHASAFGYYLEALMEFGDITGLDPRSLGRNERTAFELGFSPAQTSALQQVAFDELMATKDRPALKTFQPIALPR